MKKNLLSILFIIFIPALLNAQTLDRNYVTTNGAVRAIAQNGDTAYIGGDFTQVGLQARGIAQFTPGNTKPDISFPQLGANSTVNAAIPDDNGGFYIAGIFKNFNGVAITNNTKVLHVLNDGSLDASFNAVTADGDILCMKKNGSILYVGGAWNTIQTTNKPHLAALDAATGAINSWTPKVPDNIVEQIDVSGSRLFVEGSNITSISGYDTPTHFGVIRTTDGVYVNDFPTVNNIITGFTVSGNTLYVGGNFNQAGPGAAGIAKLSAADASVDADFPSVNGSVLAILPDGSGGYYIGGSFTKVGNKTHKNIAHILNDGTVDDAFDVTTNDDVLCLTTDGSNIFFGGNFTSVNGTSRHYAASVTIADGSLRSWNPAPDNSVLTMARISSLIYMGGWFTSVKSTPRNFAAAVTINNTLNGWAPEPNYYVNQIISNNSGTSLFMCGAFTTVSGKAHEYVVKVNKGAGAPVAWRPHPDDIVKSIALDGETIYLAGSFTSVNGIAKQFLAAVDTTNNNPTSFQADLNNYPNYLNIASGKLYVAGNYSQIQNENISYISRVDLSSGVVDSWNPVSNAYTGIVYGDGADVIAGGNFTLMNGEQKNNIAAINLNTNKFTSWSANGVAAFNVNSISKIIASDSDIFIGGDFNYFDGFNTVHNLLIIDNQLGNISHPLSQYPLGKVTQLSIFDNKLIAGGTFSNVFDLNTSTNISRKNIAAYDEANYMLSSSAYDANGSLNGMFTTASNNLIISGDFSLLNYVNRNYLAAINLNSKQVLSFDPSPDNTVDALAANENTLFVGGAFKNIGSVARNFVASINTATGNINTWNTNCDSVVNALSVDGSILYMGGLFTSVKGESRLHAAAVATTGSAALKPWAPDTDSTITAINTVNGIYIGGYFTYLKTTTRNYVAKTTAQGAVSGWNPKPNKPVLSLAANDNTIYVGGDGFTSISNHSRNALAAYTISSNALTTFDAKLKVNNTAPQVNALALSGNTLYIATTALDSLNGVSRGSLSAVNTTNSDALAFNPLPDDAVLALNVSDNYLLAGGLWNSLGDSVSPSYFAVFTLNAQKPLSSLPVATIKNEITKEEWNDAIIYPNPATNTATINFKKEISAKLSLINSNGKIIWTKNNFVGRQFQFSVQNLTAGIYFITIQSNGDIEKVKFIKK